MDSPFAALAETGDAEKLSPEVLQLLKMPNASANFATDGNAQAWVQNNLVGVIQQVKSRRSQLEEEWLAIQRMAVLKHDAGRRYMGRSNAYLPVYARSRNTLVSGLNRGLFPSEDYIDVSDKRAGHDEEAEEAKAYMQYEFDSCARLRTYMKPFLAQFEDFGIACLKYWYRTKLQTKSAKVQLTPQGPQMGATYDEGLTVSVRNMFNVVVYPENAESSRDLVFIAEFVDVTKQYVDEMRTTKRWVNVENNMAPGDDRGQRYAQQQSLNDLGAIADGTEMNGNELTQMVPVIEAWVRMPLPSAGYADGEEKGQPVPARVVIMGGQAVSITRNPYFHQCPPYLFGRQNVMSGSFYGSGVGRYVRSLQYLANDFANQSNDVGIYGLNPTLLINPQLMSGPVPPIKPGVVFKVRDLEKAMKWDRPPVELAQHGAALMQQYMSMIQDGAGAPPVMQGTGAGKAAGTATGAQILQRNALSPLQDVVEDLEGDLIVPLMQNAWALGIQYRDESVRVKVAGVDVSVLPADIDLEPQFRCLASSQAMNMQVRNQQLIQFAQMIAPMTPLLQQSGYQFDPAPLLKRIYADGFGLRGFDDIVKRAPMQPPGMGPPGAPEQPGDDQVPPGQPSADEGGGPEPQTPYSATSQAPGGGTGDMVPGEGNVMMDVRDNANSLSAQAGQGLGAP